MPCLFIVGALVTPHSRGVRAVAVHPLVPQESSTRRCGQSSDSSSCRRRCCGTPRFSTGSTVDGPSGPSSASSSRCESTCRRRAGSGGGVSRNDDRESFADNPRCRTPVAGGPRRAAGPRPPCRPPPRRLQVRLPAIETTFASMPGVEALPSIDALPDVMRTTDGRRVKSAADWNVRREEMKQILLYYAVGRMPPPPRQRHRRGPEARGAGRRGGVV